MDVRMYYLEEDPKSTTTESIMSIKQPDQIKNNEIKIIQGVDKRMPTRH